MLFWQRREERLLMISGNQAFYLNALLRGVVFGLVGVFTPIFVYKEALKITDLRGAIVLVAAYYFLLRLVVFLSAIPVSHLIERIGFRRSVTLSMVFFIVSLLLLALAQNRIWLLVFEAMFSGLVIAFYWIARRSAITQDTESKKMGRTVGFLDTMESIASFLAPFVGGTIIMVWGYPRLYLVAGLILLVSLVPLMFMPPHLHKNGASLRGFWYFLKDRRYFHQAIGMAGFVGYGYGFFIIWPLVMTQLSLSTSQVGWIFSLAAMVGVLIRMVSGSVFDRLHSKRGYYDEGLFLLVSLLVALSMIVRVFVSELTQIVLLELVSSVFAIVYSGFLLAYYQLGGKRMGAIAYYVYGEMVYSLATMLLMVMMMVGAYFAIWREIVYFVGAVWVLLSVVIARESNLR